MALNEVLAEDLAAARARSRRLTGWLDEPILRRQHDRLMSPLLWDLAHVPNYEDLWLLRALGEPATRDGLDDLYDAFKQPRNVREALPLLSLDQATAYADAVRARTLDRLERSDLAADGPHPLLREGFVHAMVAQHEHQHAETMLAALQLLPADEGHRLERAPVPPAAVLGVPDEVLVPAGPFTMGTDDPWSLDNERSAHVVELPEFWIDATPVTNERYQVFIADGGYAEPRWWSEAGWAWRLEAGLEAPQFWQRDAEGWLRLRFGQLEPVPAAEPVQHVCWYEADAFARWAGRRLPTEAEWEKAARHDPATGTNRTWPWGSDAPGPDRANVGERHLGPAPVGAYPSGASALGCHQMVGDVWEWLASDFRPHPGFVAYPYAAYSEVFFGESYRMLRGGSWATDPSVGRVTFRNWDLPIRRQIFAGFRTARG